MGRTGMELAIGSGTILIVLASIGWAKWTIARNERRGTIAWGPAHLPLAVAAAVVLWKVASPNSQSWPQVISSAALR